MAALRQALTDLLDVMFNTPVRSRETLLADHDDVKGAPWRRLTGGHEHVQRLLRTITDSKLHPA
jgi:hypothetical protein